MKRKNWLPFIFLNIIVSAATTLTVLYFWNQAHPPQEIKIEVPVNATGSQTSAQPAVLDPAALPALDETVLKIKAVIAPGDENYEYVILERVGEGALDLTGWYLENPAGAKFVFPEYQIIKGEIEVYTRVGVNNVNKLFWGETESKWQSGDTLRLFDFSGQERTTYQIP